jgi:hypothetical protein
MATRRKHDVFTPVFVIIAVRNGTCPTGITSAADLVVWRATRP